MPLYTLVCSAQTRKLLPILQNPDRGPTGSLPGQGGHPGHPLSWHALPWWHLITLPVLHPPHRPSHRGMLGHRETEAWKEKPCRLVGRCQADGPTDPVLLCVFVGLYYPLGACSKCRNLPVPAVGPPVGGRGHHTVSRSPRTDVTKLPQTLRLSRPAAGSVSRKSPYP